MSSIFIDQAAQVGAGPSSASEAGLANPPLPQLVRRRKPRLSKNPKNFIAPSILRMCPLVVFRLASIVY
jgi:hypothetical protein